MVDEWIVGMERALLKGTDFDSVRKVEVVDRVHN